MSTFCRFLLVLALAASPLPAEDRAPVYQPVEAQELRPRDGLGNVLAKLQAGRQVKIAYLGGSITAAVGWRVKSREWFTGEFPAAAVTEINAAIGGTGSDLGVFRLYHDALVHRPDLLFVEFAVNDGGASPERIWQAMEGIVRQTWRADPRTDICFVYTFRVGYEKDLEQGLCPRAASAMEMLADHYGIPSVNFAARVVQMQQEGKLVYQSDEPPPDGMIQFSRDGVHPLDDGHQIYVEALGQAVDQMRSASQPVDHGPKLQGCFVADHWEVAKMVPLQPGMLTGNWKQLPDDHHLVRSFGDRMGRMWEGDEPGNQITFRFRGSQAKLYDLLGPDGGQVLISVDEEKRDRRVPRFDSYCTYHRIATLQIAEGLDPSQVHTVTVEIDPEQPDRTPVAFRLQNPGEELKSEKYQGTYVRASQILLLGDLVD